MLRHDIVLTICLLCLSVSCTSPNQMSKKHESESMDNHLIQDQLIVQLKGEVDAKAFIETYADYELTIKKVINKRMNLWVMKYDPKKIDPNKMLDLLRSSEDVNQVEFDKQVDLRKE